MAAEEHKLLVFGGNGSPPPPPPASPTAVAGKASAKSTRSASKAAKPEADAKPERRPAAASTYLADLWSLDLERWTWQQLKPEGQVRTTLGLEQMYPVYFCMYISTQQIAKGGFLVIAWSSTLLCPQT